jgi:hypothetical protein
MKLNLNLKINKLFIWFSDVFQSQKCGDADDKLFFVVDSSVF